MYAIDKGVPLPEPTKRTSKIYPFHQMEIGDSFSVPISASARVGNAVTKYQNAHKAQGVKFARRKIDAETIRIWRVA